MKMHFPFQPKLGVIVITITIISVVSGIYIGAFFVERDGIRKLMEESLIHTALNLQAIKDIREGRLTNAVKLLNSMNETNLVYLMHYDDVASKNEEFIKLKKKVLSDLKKERSQYPEIGDASSFKSGPEWEEYQRDLDQYLKQNQ